MSVRRVSNVFTDFIKAKPSEDQYFRFTAEDDDGKIIASLSMVERLYPDQVLMLCNRSHPRLHYVGSNCSNIFGFGPKEFAGMEVQDFFRCIHPEDLHPLLECFEFINAAEPYDPVTHRFVLHYRFRKKSGYYIHLRDEKLAIENDNGKFIYFTMFRDISEHEKFFHVRLDIHQYTKGRVRKVYTYNPRQGDHAMTPRQNEIVKLIIKGFSTQEIADRLNVSINTVKNHKQILFRKVNVKSSVELINFAARRDKS